MNHLAEKAAVALRDGWTDLQWSMPCHPMAAGSATYKSEAELPETAYLMGKPPGGKDWRSPETGIGGYEVKRIA